MIHKTHVASVMAYKNYNYADVLFNEVLYPQDIRNCNKCHDATNPTTPDAKNCRNVPSRLACGACHDGIDFATGHGVTMADAWTGLTETTLYHGLCTRAGPQPDDSHCLQCHGPDVTSTRYHTPVTPPNPGNALRAWRERQHQRGLDRLQPRPEADRGDRGHLRHQERLGEREQAARSSCSGCCRTVSGRTSTTSRPRQPIRRQDRRRSGTTSWAGPASTSCSRCRRTE